MIQCIQERPPEKGLKMNCITFPSWKQKKEDNLPRVYSEVSDNATSCPSSASGFLPIASWLLHLFPLFFIPWAASCLWVWLPVKWELQGFFKKELCLLTTSTSAWILIPITGQLSLLKNCKPNANYLKYHPESEVATSPSSVVKTSFNSGKSLFE